MLLLYMQVRTICVAAALALAPVYAVGAQAQQCLAPFRVSAAPFAAEPLDAGAVRALETRGLTPPDPAELQTEGDTYIDTLLGERYPDYQRLDGDENGAATMLVTPQITGVQVRLKEIVTRTKRTVVIEPEADADADTDGETSTDADAETGADADIDAEQEIDAGSPDEITGTPPPFPDAPALNGDEAGADGAVTEGGAPPALVDVSVPRDDTDTIAPESTADTLLEESDAESDAEIPGDGSVDISIEETPAAPPVTETVIDIKRTMRVEVRVHTRFEFVDLHREGRTSKIGAAETVSSSVELADEYPEGDSEQERIDAELAHTVLRSLRGSIDKAMIEAAQQALLRQEIELQLVYRRQFFVAGGRDAGLRVGDWLRVADVAPAVEEAEPVETEPESTETESAETDTEIEAQPEETQSTETEPVETESTEAEPVETDTEIEAEPVEIETDSAATETADKICPEAAEGRKGLPPLLRVTELFDLFAVARNVGSHVIPVNTRLVSVPHTWTVEPYAGVNVRALPLGAGREFAPVIPHVGVRNYPRSGNDLLRPFFGVQVDTVIEPSRVIVPGHIFGGLDMHWQTERFTLRPAIAGAIGPAGIFNTAGMNAGGVMEAPAAVDFILYAGVMANIRSQIVLTPTLDIIIDVGYTQYLPLYTTAPDSAITVSEALFNGYGGVLAGIALAIHI